MAETIVIDGWCASPLADFGGPWLSADFEQLARKFLGAFRTADGTRVDRPAIITRERSGADGLPPSRDEHAALRLAIGFATLDANPYWRPESDGWNCSTADNADVWVQPIDLMAQRFTIEKGFRVSTLAGGLRLDDSLVIPVPVEVHFPRSVRIDDGLATTIYELATRRDANDPNVERVIVAIDWFVQSWRNTPSLSWENRLVQTKTAFEALLDESDTGKALTLLRDMFADAHPYPTGALWQPNESTKPRTVSGTTYDVTLVEHWYGALSDARNTIIHEGRTGSSVLVYNEQSPYAGPFVDIGDRVLREAVKAKLVTLGYEKAAMTPSHRAVRDAAKKPHAEDPTDPDDDARAEPPS